MTVPPGGGPSSIAPPRSAPRPGLCRAQRLPVRVLGQMCEHRESEGKIEPLVERTPLRREVRRGQGRGDAVGATDIEDPLYGIAAVQPAGGHVGGGLLLAAPDGGALFEEGGHALLRVVGERVVGHDDLAVLVGFVLGAVDLGVEGVLPHGDRVCA